MPPSGPSTRQGSTGGAGQVVLSPRPQTCSGRGRERQGLERWRGLRAGGVIWGMGLCAAREAPPQGEGFYAGKWHRTWRDSYLLSFGAVAPGLGIILFKPCKNPWGRRVMVFLLQGKT